MHNSISVLDIHGRVRVSLQNKMPSSYLRDVLRTNPRHVRLSSAKNVARHSIQQHLPQSSSESDQHTSLLNMIKCNIFDELDMRHVSNRTKDRCNGIESRGGKPAPELLCANYSSSFPPFTAVYPAHDTSTSRQAHEGTRATISSIPPARNEIGGIGAELTAGNSWPEIWRLRDRF